MGVIFLVLVVSEIMFLWFSYIEYVHMHTYIITRWIGSDVTGTWHSCNIPSNIILFDLHTDELQFM